MTTSAVRLSKRFNAVAAGIVLFLLPGIVDGQNASKLQGQIVNIEAKETIVVEFDVRASDREVVVPYCSQDADGQHILCPGLAYLEVLDGKTWSRAKPRRGLLAVLGAPSKDALKPVRIAPAREEHFVFSFNPGLFGIQKGARLRVKLGVWETEEEMHTRDPDVVLVGPEFACP